MMKTEDENITSDLKTIFMLKSDSIIIFIWYTEEQLIIHTLYISQSVFF